MKNLIILVLTSISIFFVTTSYVIGQETVKQFYENTIPVYPGAELIESNQNNNYLIKKLKTLDEPNTIIIFFKKKLLMNNWIIKSNKVNEIDREIVFIKDSKLIQIIAHSDENKENIIEIKVII